MHVNRMLMWVLLIAGIVPLGWRVGAIAQTRAPEGSKSLAWGLTDAVHRIFPDEPYAGPMGNEWQIDAARNEYESCQLVLIAGSEDVRMAEVRARAFEGPAGVEIPASATTVRLVRTARVNDREWPDPLPEAYPIDIQQGALQTYWITVHVPADASAGVYRSTVAVSTMSRENGGAVEIPLQLRVRDFDVPTVSRYQMVGATPDLGRQYHIAHWLGGVLLRPKGVKMTLDEHDDLQLDFEAFDRNVEQELARGVRELSLGLAYTGAGGFHRDSFDFRAHEDGRVFLATDDPTGTPGSRRVWLCPVDRDDPDADTPEIRKARKYFTQYLSQIYEHLEAKGWTSHFSVYGADEPHGPKWPEPLKRYFALIKQIAPKLRIMITYSPTDRFGPHVDVGCIMMNHLGPETIRTARKHGQELWCYSCGDLNNPALTIPHDAIKVRLWHWLQEKWHIRRTLLWQTVIGGDRFIDPGIDGKGDGQIFWRQGPGRFFPGIRAELLRDGIEDREYLRTLRELTSALSAKKTGGDVKEGLLARARQLAEVPDGLVETQFKMTGDVGRLLERRDRIADTIERLQRALDEDS